MTQDSAEWADFRPDMLGSVGVEHADGDYTVLLFFTTEAEAREGERKEMPEDMKAQMEEMQSLEVGQPKFLDLRRPWLHSTS